MSNVRKRIQHNLTTHEIVKPNGKRITVPSSDKYVSNVVLGTALGLAFARSIIGKDFAK